MEKLTELMKDKRMRKNPECRTAHYLVMLTVGCGKIDMEEKDENENEKEPGVHTSYRSTFSYMKKYQFSIE